MWLNVRWMHRNQVQKVGCFIENSRMRDREIMKNIIHSLHSNASTALRCSMITYLWVWYIGRRISFIIRCNLDYDDTHTNTWRKTNIYTKTHSHFKLSGLDSWFVCLFCYCFFNFNCLWCYIIQYRSIGMISLIEKKKTNCVYQIFSKVTISSRIHVSCKNLFFSYIFEIEAHDVF